MNSFTFPSALAVLGALAAITPATAYPPAPYYRIYGAVRNEQGRPLATGEGSVILSGTHSGLGTASVSAGSVSGVIVLNGGSGYTSPPLVEFFGAAGTGTGAAGTAILTDGVVTDVSVSNTGSGYTAPVTVGFLGGGVPPLEIVRSPSDPSIAPGVNYALAVPMDSGTEAQFYEVSAMRPLLPFTIRVLIDGVNHVPIQIAGATSAFWTDRINSVNSPGIQTRGSHWAIGRPADKLRLDLTLGIDADGDGLPDGWEQALVDADPNDGLDSLSDVTPGDDADGDGTSNLVEYLAGTYAFDRRDRFELEIVSVSDEIAQLRFLAITGRTYHIEASDDLRTWTSPRPFSLNSNGTDPISYYRAEDARFLTVYMTLGESPPMTGFRLHID